MLRISIRWNVKDLNDVVCQIFKTLLVIKITQKIFKKYNNAFNKITIIKTKN